MIRNYWKAITPLIIIIVIALLPVPTGLTQNAWYFLAIFVSVIIGLVLEPLPGGAIGMLGVTLVALLAPYVLYTPAQLVQPGFHPIDASIAWALSGFSNSIVWLIFAAFMFALGYDRTGLGKRISLLLVKFMGRRTLTLGYAIMLADCVLAPFTPSVTARSGGIIYPIIHNLPSLYDSKPNDPSSRKIGSYLMWVAIASTCVTSSLFLTALAPNLLALELIKETIHVHIGWMQWFKASAPVGILLLLLVPILTYWLYPPSVKKGNEVVNWATKELAIMGKLTRHECILSVLVVIALLLWIFGGHYVDQTTAALIVISLMLVTGILTWDDIIKNSSAWNTLTWFATLIALADGLNQVGIIKWFGVFIGHYIAGFSPVTAVFLLVIIFYVLHYVFASSTAHVTAMFPVMLAVGGAIPGMPMANFSLILCISLGIMGIITPYALGPSPIYYGSGYLPAADYWRMGTIFGCIFLFIFLAVGVPWILFSGL